MAELLGTNNPTKRIEAQWTRRPVIGQRMIYSSLGEVFSTSPVLNVLYINQNTKKGVKCVAFDTQNTRYIIETPTIID